MGSNYGEHFELIQAKRRIQIQERKLSELQAQLDDAKLEAGRYGLALRDSARTVADLEAQLAAAERGAGLVADVWRPIETAPKNESILLSCGNKYIPIYCGRYRRGNLGEPQQDVLAWRCDSSGRFANPTQWAPIPPTKEVDDGQQ